MEYLRGGELLDQLRKNQSFTEAQVSFLFRQLVSAVHFMHSKRVVHRDLKPEVGVAYGGFTYGVPSVSKLYIAIMGVATILTKWLCFRV